MNIEKRRAEIAARKSEIRKLNEGDSENKLNMDDLEKELRELNEEDEKLEKRQAIERMLNGGAAPASPAGLSNPVARSANQPAPESAEKLYRSAWLKTLQGKPLTDDEKRAYPKIFLLFLILKRFFLCGDDNDLRFRAGLRHASSHSSKT